MKLGSLRTTVAGLSLLFLSLLVAVVSGQYINIALCSTYVLIRNFSLDQTPARSANGAFFVSRPVEIPNWSLLEQGILFLMSLPSPYIISPAYVFLVLIFFKCCARRFASAQLGTCIRENTD